VSVACAAERSSPHELVAHLDALKKENDWRSSAAYAKTLPSPLTAEWVGVASRVAFALGQLGDHVQALALFEACYTLAPNGRDAAAAAYQCYCQLLRQARVSERRGSRSRRRETPHGEPPNPDRQELRQKFLDWTERALQHQPDDIKVHYRLGIFEAQIEAAHDKVALRAFARVIRLYGELPEEQRRKRGDLRKYAHKALYAAARSALRLGRLSLARQLVFRCIREDEPTNDLEPVHKLTLAGKVLLAQGELDHAERAFRKALDAKGPPMRDYLFALLAKVDAARGDVASACRWIEEHIRPQRRSPAVWRLLGELELRRGNDDAALNALRNALARDRSGRHLTLRLIGEIEERRGNLRAAERAYEEAIAFRSRVFLREDPDVRKKLEAVRASRTKEPARGALEEERPGLAKARTTQAAPERRRNVR
jgi:tetratricopeptide (TPR) repeat protein